MTTITKDVNRSAKPQPSTFAAALATLLGLATLGLNLDILFKQMPPIDKACIGTADKTIIIDAHSHLLDVLQLDYEIGTLLLLLFGASTAFLLTRIGGGKYAVAWFLVGGLTGFAEWQFGDSVHGLVSAEQPNYQLLRALVPSLPIICWLAIAAVLAFPIWLKWAQPQFKPSKR